MNISRKSFLRSALGSLAALVVGREVKAGVEPIDATGDVDKFASEWWYPYGATADEVLGTACSLRRLMEQSELDVINGNSTIWIHDIFVGPIYGPRPTGRIAIVVRSQSASDEEMQHFIEDLKCFADNHVVMVRECESPIKAFGLAPHTPLFPLPNCSGVNQ